MSRKRYCPACGSRMVAERIRHRAVNPEGRSVLYYNVWRYECPQGCATTTLDFSQASLDPEGRTRGLRLAVETGPEGEIVVTPTLLDRVDLSYLITVIGLILGYAMFAWALIVVDVSPVGKIIAAALLTLGAFYVVINMTTAPKSQSTVVIPQAAAANARDGEAEATSGGDKQAAE